MRAYTPRRPSHNGIEAENARLGCVYAAGANPGERAVTRVTSKNRGQAGARRSLQEMQSSHDLVGQNYAAEIEHIRGDSECKTWSSLAFPDVRMYDRGSLEGERSQGQRWRRQMFLRRQSCNDDRDGGDGEVPVDASSDEKRLPLSHRRGLSHDDDTSRHTTVQARPCTDDDDPPLSSSPALVMHASTLPHSASISRTV